MAVAQIPLIYVIKQKGLRHLYTVILYTLPYLLWLIINKQAPRSLMLAYAGLSCMDIQPGPTQVSTASLEVFPLIIRFSNDAIFL